MTKLTLTRRSVLTLTGNLLAGNLLAGGLLVGCDQDVQAEKEQTDQLLQLSPQGTVPEVVTIGITPSLGKKTHERLAPLMEYMTERLGRKVVGRTPETYAQLSKMVESGDVDIGIFSPAAYVRARQKVPAIAIATATRNGSPTYLGYLVVKLPEGQDGHSKKPLLESLAGKRIAWVNTSSTSGYLYPRAMLRWRGKDPDTFFGETTFAKNHDRAIQMVVQGEVDVAAVASPFVDFDSIQRHDEAHGLQVIAKTRRIPLDCVVVHKRTQRKLGMDLRTVLLSVVDDPSLSDRLERSWGLDGFVKPLHKAYEAVADVIRESPT